VVPVEVLMKGNALMIGLSLALTAVWVALVAGSLAVFSGYPLALRLPTQPAPPAAVAAPPCRVAATVQCAPNAL